MKARFWGVRGSIPVPGPSTMRYGGNTSCVEVRPREDLIFIVDCGTGVRECGNSLLGKGPVNGHIFISHTHWDHIHGFPFFVPAYIPGNTFLIHGPSVHEEKFEATMRAQMEFKVFPVKLGWMASKLQFKELGLGGDTFELEGVKISTRRLNHPVPTLGYRFDYEGQSVVTMFDTERWFNLFAAGKKEEKEGAEDDPLDFLSDDGASDAEIEEGEKTAQEENEKDIAFARGADLLILDTQYTQKEYDTTKKAGWGHSTIEQGLALGEAAGVKRLAFFHHEPMRNDDGIAALEDFCYDTIKEKGLKFQMFAATEKLEVDVSISAEEQKFGAFARK